MSYGTTSYGSAAIGGSAASQWFIFLPFLARAQGTYEIEAELSLTDPAFSIFLQKASENTDVIIEVFTRNDPDESPQSQGSFGGLYAQYVIGSARFIKIAAIINQVGGELLTVRGRPGS